MKRISLIFILFLSIFNVNGQVDKIYFSVEELKQDFKIFRVSLEEGHPGIYRYSSQQEMDSVFSLAETSISKPMTEQEFKLLLSKVVNHIGCGHTKVVAPKPEQDKLDEGTTAIPFQINYEGGKIFALRNFSTLSDKEFVGAEIISINGHTMIDFVNQFISVFPSDGHNMTHKYRMLSSSRMFTRYFYYLYEYAESYDVEFKLLTDATVRKSTLAGITFDQLLTIRKQRYPILVSQSPVEFNLYEDKKTAYLRIDNFDKGALKKTNVSFSKFLKSSFKKIERNHIQNLILDLRYNGGGTDEYGKLLFSYFVDHDFDYYSSLTMNKETYDFFKYTNRPDMKAPKGMLKANQSGTFDNVQHPNFGKQKATFPTFRGNIYVLINGSCFSTTSECLSMIHSYTKSVFIGEESGGGYYGNNSGPTPDLTLPNTKIRIEIPLMKYVMAVKEYPFADRGIIPDYKVTPTTQEKINNKDPELDFAKDLISKGIFKQK
jgi:hypothetical protein